MVRGEISLNRRRDNEKYKFIVIPFMPNTCAKGHSLDKVAVDFDKKYMTGYRCRTCNKIYILYEEQ